MEKLLTIVNPHAVRGLFATLSLVIVRKVLIKSPILIMVRHSIDPPPLIRRMSLVMILTLLDGCTESNIQK